LFELKALRLLISHELFVGILIVLKGEFLFLLRLEVYFLFAFDAFVGLPG
jgi:hypothetical protein